MQTIGSRIFEKRTELELSTLQLAQLLHITEETVCAWESGTAAPEMQLLPQLSKALQVDPDYLIYGKAPQAMKEPTAATLQEAPQSLLRAHTVLAPLFAALTVLSAAILHAITKNPRLSFFVGAAVCAAGLGITMILSIAAAVRSTEKKSIWLRTEGLLSLLLIALAVILPPGILSGSEGQISGTDWFFFGGIFLWITAAFCIVSATVINLAAGYWHRSALSDPAVRIKLFHLGLAAALLVITFSAHAITGLQSPAFQKPSGKGIRFASWQDFSTFMQRPMDAEGNQLLTLVRIEPTRDNLTYHFVDESGKPVVVENAVCAVVHEKTYDVLCTYLNLNQFVRKIEFSNSAKKLPVTVYTGDDFAAPLSSFSLHLIFVIAYCLEAAVVFWLYRHKMVRYEALARYLASKKA